MRTMMKSALAMLVVYGLLAVQPALGGDCGKDHKKDSDCDKNKTSQKQANWDNKDNWQKDANRQARQREQYSTWNQRDRGELLNTREQYQPQLRRVGKIVGMPLTTYKGEDIGEIESLAIDPDHNRVAFAVVRTGATLGLGGKQRAVPFQLIWGSTHGDRLLIAASADQVKSAHDFSKSECEKMCDREWSEKAHAEYRVDPYWESDYGMASWRRSSWPRRQEKDALIDRDSEREQARDQRQPGQVVMSNTLIGEDIESTQDEDLGEINDLLVDMSNGHIGFAVVEYGGTLGMNQSLTAVPFDRITVRSSDEMDNIELVAQVSKQKIENAPSFKENNWPELTSRQWNEDVHSHYDVEPYYVIYGYVQLRPEELFNRENVHTIKGRIRSISRHGTGLGLDEPGVQIRIEPTDSGDVHFRGSAVRVGIAPEDFLSKHNLNLKVDQDVTIKGIVSSQGREATEIIASEITVDGQTVRLRNDRGNPKW